MLTIDTVLRDAQQDLDGGYGQSALNTLTAAIEARQTRLDAIIATVDAEGRGDLLASEARNVDAIRAELKRLLALRKVAEKVAENEDPHRALREARAAADRMAATLPQTPGTSVRVGLEPRTYHDGPAGPSIVRDMMASKLYGDPTATERLQRHAAETAAEHRDIGTSAMVGLVPPQYLLDHVAPLARAGRVTADLCTKLPLPAEGMTVNISRITTGTAVAAQANENDAAQETNADDTLLTVNVNTIAGQQDVSRQLVERSMGGAADRVILGELAGAYAAELGRQVINGSAASGEHRGILNVSGILSVTYTDASPTLIELLPKVADAVQQVQTNRYAGPTAIVMHPRRWAWALKELDTSNRPLISPSAGGPTNAPGVATSVGYGESVGVLVGLPVYIDANIPTNLGGGTNEDRIIVAHFPDHCLWEQQSGTPFLLRFEETNAGNLSVKLVAYGYSAFSAGRYPAATAVISGTGLVTPSF